MASTPTVKLNRVPVSEVLLVLLRHFRQILADGGLALTDDTSRELARALASGEPHAAMDALVSILTELVEASLGELETRWQLDFAAALRADMSSIGGWETTAEYLELANDKAELETRIAGGSALLVAAGRSKYAANLVDVIEYDAGALDIDAVVAKRVLLHVSGVDGSGPDWLLRVQQWQDSATPPPATS